MIVKHVPMQSAHKSNFAESVKYMLDEQKKYERVGYVQATNCRTQNIDVAVLAIQPGRVGTTLCSRGLR